METIKKSEELNLEKELLAPYTHMIKTTENLPFTRALWAFNHWLNVPDHLFLRVKEYLTMVIGGSIMIDDVQDESMVRDGLPTAQYVYGIPLALNAGYQVIAVSMQKVGDLVPNGLGLKVYAEHLHEVWEGQGTEIYWRNNFLCPTEEQYTKMQLQKCGGYLMLGVKLLQLLSDNKKNYENFGQLIAHYLQLQNDYSNLCDKELNQNGVFCEDITEGKFTLPIIHAMKTPAGPEVLNILKKRTRDVELKKYCLSLLEKTGSLQYTRERLDKLDRETRAEMARLGNNPQMEIILEELSSWKEDTTCL